MFPYTTETEKALTSGLLDEASHQEECVVDEGEESKEEEEEDDDQQEEVLSLSACQCFVKTSSLC